MAEGLEGREIYGYAALEPAGEVVAGSLGTWRFTYVAGSRGVATGGCIRVHTDSDTDWGLPQFHDPRAQDYMTIQAPEGVRVAVIVENVRSLLLAVMGRGLRAGERVVLTYGDTGGGCPGSRAQTFQEGRRFFRVAVDAAADGRFVELSDQPYVSIVGGAIARLIAIAPSVVLLGEPFRLLARAQDPWGNPAAGYRGRVNLQAPGVELSTSSYAFTPQDGGVHWFEGVKCTSAGIQRIALSDEENGLSARSNPFWCVGEGAECRLYWGDPHGGQVVSAEKIPDFFRYAREVAGVDFAGYQRNDHEVSREDWALQQAAEREFYQPGRFVPLPGFEWSGRTEEGGHHNIYFRRHGQPIRRSSHSAVEDKSDRETDLPHISDVYQAYRYADALVTAHVGGGHADLCYHEPNLEPAIEVTSTHGTFEWFLEEALRRGYKLGFIGGSDGYTGRPGAEYPGYQERRFAKGGLAALYARELTLESIFEALKARRAYGTTGARILVHLSCQGHPMGQEYSTSSPPRISALVAGTAPLEAVELYRGLKKLYSHPLELPPDPRRVRLLWEGASRKTSYSGVVWEGILKVSGAEIAGVQTLRFDSPRSRVYDLAGQGLRWYAVSCGYPSGIVLELKEASHAEFQMAVSTSLIVRASLGGFGDLPPNRMSYAPAERLAFGFSLQELASGPKVLEIGHLNRRLTVSLAPGAGEEVGEFTFTDTSPEPGINPYWLRVVQTDMEMAWTSPVFVDYVARP